MGKAAAPSGEHEAVQKQLQAPPPSLVRKYKEAVFPAPGAGTPSQKLKLSIGSWSLKGVRPLLRIPPKGQAVGRRPSFLRPVPILPHCTKSPSKKPVDTGVWVAQPTGLAPVIQNRAGKRKEWN